MPEFEYKAVSTNDEPEQGVVDASDLAHALEQLHDRGLRVTAIAVHDRDRQIDLEAASATQRNPLTTAVQRLVDRNQEYAPALRAYAADGAPGPRKRELRAIADALATGTVQEAVAEAESNLTAWAPPLAAAAAPGDQGVFDRLFTREAPPIATASRGGAFAYPLFLLVLLALVSWPISALILPVFENVFNEFGLSLPALTELVLTVGRLVRVSGVFWLLAALAAFVLSAFWPFRKRGVNRRNSQHARLLANLAESGLLPTRDTKAHGHRSTPSIRFALDGVSDPHARVAVLRELSECYSERAATRGSWAGGAAGQIALVVVGAAVGLVVLALMLPLVKLIEGLT